MTQYRTNDTAEDGGAHRLPKRGDYLYQAMHDERIANIGVCPPAVIRRIRDRSGAQTITVFTEGNGLSEAVKLFMQIRVAGPEGLWKTDGYNRIFFGWKDGSESWISLNHYDLEYHMDGKRYLFVLKDLRPFWEFRAEADGFRRGRF